MDTQQFYEKAARRAEQIINLIAGREYDKLPAVTGSIYLGWGERRPAEEELANLTKWIDAQLKLLSEDEGREYVIDPFKAQYFRIMGDGDTEKTCATYDPRSHGEQLDFWFEFEFSLGEDGEVVSEIAVNV